MGKWRKKFREDAKNDLKKRKAKQKVRKKQKRLRPVLFPTEGLEAEVKQTKSLAKQRKPPAHSSRFSAWEKAQVDAEREANDLKQAKERMKREHKLAVLDKRLKLMTAQSDESLTVNQRLKQLKKLTRKKKKGKKRKKASLADFVLAELRSGNSSISATAKSKSKSKTQSTDNGTADDSHQLDDSWSQPTLCSVGSLGESQFRYMNEVLYTTTGAEALAKVSAHRDEFAAYHSAYNRVVEDKWPQSPLQIIHKHLMRYFKENKHLKAPVVADFGCGDAKLAKAFSQSKRSRRVTVHSFDLCALNDFVTVCDMSSVPLADNSVDVAVFCLSLMGTNFHEYLREAHRVLRPMGVLKIAEVKSRLVATATRFRGLLQLCGFEVLRENNNNTHFVLFHCVKSLTQKCKITDAFDTSTVLKPCLYKKR